MKRFIAGLTMGALLVGSMAVPASAQLLGDTTVPTVVDFGEEPRQPLRYEYAEGETQAVRFGMDMDMAMTMDGVPITEMSIPFESEMEFTITDVLPDGSARMEFVYTAFDFGDLGVSLNPELLEAEGDSVDEAMEVASDELDLGTDALVGVTGWQVVDPLGAIIEFGMDMPEAFPAELRSQFDGAVQSIQQLPEEPVGVGARWVADMQMDSGGLPVSLTTETELLEIEDGFVTLGTTMSVDSGVLDEMAADMPPDVQVEAAEMDMSGAAEARVDLRNAIAEMESDLSMRMELLMTAETEGVSQTVDFAADVILSMYMEPLE